ncbi:helix-turn-helix domain-containing protein [Halomicroarcula sp. S3CR25-11]|uniref:Helix-turn-helix domain-containing protein n=2 Tax=Haloarcula onubensis TaxID=2950539 RepID=A0ABU2FMW7_9EURY|nr:helix-turn-helix domain-containing protein [Halomicroarcula sp. S3CR25-11]
MGDHILSEVAVFGPESCCVEPHATDSWTVTDVDRSRLGGDSNEVHAVFTLTGDPGATLPASVDRAGVERVFSYDDRHVFRVTRPDGQGCVCDCLERAGCVVRDITVEPESLVVTFLVEDADLLGTVLDELRATADCIQLRRLVESARANDEARPIVFDRATLTDRQEEVLRVALEMGYFEHPRDATAGDVAAKLDITTTTFTEHLAAAQGKLLTGVLG